MSTPKQNAGTEASAEHQYPSTLKAFTTMASILTATFLVALDRTIISTAIPYITNEFNSIKDIAWYGSSYLLPAATLPLCYSTLYKYNPPRSIFILALSLFELGSILCAAAPTSTTLIIGRAIAGAGAAGVLSGAMQILFSIVPLHKRPVWAGLMSSMSGVASVVSPLIAGAFTERVTWRWCFWINVPFGVVAGFIVWVFVGGIEAPSVSLSSSSGSESWKTIFHLIDFSGMILFLGWVVCLILALQWGGDLGWHDGRVIALLVCFGVLMIIWICVQIYKKDLATIPGRIFLQRSILAAFFFSMTSTSALMILVYYIPTWFQAIKGDTPVNAGLSFTPFLLAMVAGSILGGILTTRIGFYNLTTILSGVISPIGIGLLASQFGPRTAHPVWIGLQVVCGFGLGLSLQSPILAVQNVLSRPDIPVGMGVIFFGQQLGGAVFLSIAEAMFSRILSEKLGTLNSLSADDARKIASAGATDFRHAVPDSLLPQVLDKYSLAITQTWYLALGLAAMSIFPALFLEWKSIKEKNGKGGSSPAAARPKAGEHSGQHPLADEKV